MNGFAVVVILVLCSPLVLGPLLIPTGKRRKTRKTLRKLHGDPKKGERLPEGFLIHPLTATCDVQVEACATKADCGGRLHGIAEEFPSGSDPPARYSRLANACFVCGRFDKTGRPSDILGQAFDGVTDVESLKQALKDARWRKRYAVARLA